MRFMRESTTKDYQEPLQNKSSIWKNMYKKKRIRPERLDNDRLDREDNVHLEEQA